MLGENKSIGIVVVNYFSSDLIRELLGGLDTTSYSGVVLVDNSDDAEEWSKITELADSRGARSLRMESNLGFGSGVNRGAELLDSATCKYIWILNPDTRVEEDTAARLVTTLKESNSDIVSPLIVTDAGDRVWFAGGDLDISRGRTSHRTVVPTGVTECDFITGAAMMLDFDCWRELGGFREDLFMYWEDADLCIRARNGGLRMVVAPHVRIWHAVGATSAESGKSSLYYFYMQRNRVIVIAQTFGVGRLFRANAVTEAFRILYRAMREQSAPVAKSIAALRGILDAIQLLARESQLPDRTA